MKYLLMTLVLITTFSGVCVDYPPLRMSEKIRYISDSSHFNDLISQIPEKNRYTKEDEVISVKVNEPFLMTFGNGGTYDLKLKSEQEQYLIQLWFTQMVNILYFYRVK